MKTLTSIGVLALIFAIVWLVDILVYSLVCQFRHRATYIPRYAIIMVCSAWAVSFIFLTLGYVL